MRARVAVDSAEASMRLRAARAIARNRAGETCGAPTRESVMLQDTCTELSTRIAQAASALVRLRGKIDAIAVRSRASKESVCTAVWLLIPVA